MTYNEMLEMVESRITENENTFEQKKSNEHAFDFYSGKLDALYELKKTIELFVTE
jgi:hypothetical protein